MKIALSMLSLAALLLAGCGGQAASPTTALPTPVQPASDSHVTMLGVTDDGVDTLSTLHVGIRLTGESSFMSPRYGFVLGYFKGKTSTTSEVITLATATPVRFFNVDTVLTHTLSFLGKATSQMAPWPASFDGSSTASPAGRAIGTTNFSTGPLSAGAKSLLYNTGMPGFYMVGCAFHYNLDKMRTVIIVK